jgi:hypothetical protein
MSDAHSVFVIPTFQRPYAWEKEHIHDLQEDIKKTVKLLTSNSNDIHYLAPIHLIPYSTSDRRDKTLEAYLPKNDDVTLLLKSLNEQESEFINTDYEPLHVYFVIDGQQRLTTLYFIYTFVYRRISSNPLNVTLLCGRQIPRLIHNDPYNHTYFKALLSNIASSNTLPISNTQAFFYSDQAVMSRKPAWMLDWFFKRSKM